MARVPISNLDYTTRDYEGFRTLMIQRLQELMPEYTDIRQSDAGIVILELNAMCLDILSYYLDSISNECFLTTAEQRSNIVKFCKMLGYTPRYATAAKYKQIFIRTNTDEEVIIPAGTKVKTYSSNPDSQIYFTTLTDLVIPKGAVGDEINEETKEYLYTTEVIHGLYVNNETLIDYSTGHENQTYSLNYAPALINDSFRVYVNSSENHCWKRVSSFAGSNSKSEVYTLEINDYNETSIVFGNDVFGMSPPEGSTITCTYYVGGGDSGNVGLGAICEMEDNLANVKETKNVAIVEYGYDQETLDEIKVNAPIAHRNIWGALTCDDFSGVIKTYFPDIKDSDSKKASEDWTVPEVDDLVIYILTNDEIQEIVSKQDKMQSLFSPKLPEEYYSNPKGKFALITNNVQNFFNSNEDYVDIGSGTGLDSGRKLVGMRDIILKRANFVGITLEYTLMVREYYDINTISKQVDNYLSNYFKVGNVKFGQEISLQNVMYDIVDNSGIEGIRYLNIVSGNPGQTVKNEYFTVIGGDLIIPEKGTILTLGGLGRHFQNTSSTYSGGATVSG